MISYKSHLIDHRKCKNIFQLYHTIDTMYLLSIPLILLQKTGENCRATSCNPFLIITSHAKTRVVNTLTICTNGTALRAESCISEY